MWTCYRLMMRAGRPAHGLLKGDPTGFRSLESRRVLWALDAGLGCDGVGGPCRDALLVCARICLTDRRKRLRICGCGILSEKTAAADGSERVSSVPRTRVRDSRQCPACSVAMALSCLASRASKPGAVVGGGFDQSNEEIRDSGLRARACGFV